MARSRRVGGPGCSDLLQELGFWHAGHHEIEAQQIGVDPRREEGDVVALDRGPHLGLEAIAIEDLLAIGAVFLTKRRRALQIEEKLAQPVISHGAYFAMSMARMALIASLQGPAA